MNIKEKIIALDKERYSKVYNLEIDEKAQELADLIRKNSDELDFDFIMEQLAHLGQCVCLLNDDNGHWAVTADGYQNVVTGRPKNLVTQFFVEAKQWKSTPRKALKQYLSE